MKLESTHLLRAKRLACFVGICLIGTLGALWVARILIAQPLLAGDYGQWLMFARYYQGATYPDYLDPRSVHPLLPILLATATSILDNSLTAVVITSSVLFFLVIVTTANVVYALSNNPLASIIAAFLVAFGQYVIPYMTTGLLPQMGGLVGINLIVTSFPSMLRSPRRRSSWGLLSAGFIIAAFFHFPTAPIAFLISTVGIIYVSYVAKSFDGLWRRFIIYLGFPAVAWCAYLLAFQEVSREYVVNRSAYYRLAPSTVLKFISIGPEFFAFMIVGVLAALSLLILTKKRENLFVGTILIMWLVAPLVFLTISYALGIGTDYSRFIYYFIPPSIAAISIVFGNFVRMLAEANQQARSSRANGLTVIIVTFMLLVIFNLRFSLHFYHQTVDDLSLVYRSSFRTAVSWINDHQISGTIFAPSRPEATWIEGLTGNDTLFPEEFRYIYRPGMMQRALDAHQIDSGTPLVVDNGYMRIYLHEPGEGSRWHPYVTVYDRGEYAELITLQDHLVSVSYSHRDSLQSLQLSEDFDVVTEVVATPVGTKVVYTYEAILHPVVLTKQVFLPKNGSYMQIAIDLHFSDQFHGREMNLKFADIARLYGEEVIRDTETTGLTVQDSSTVQLFRGSRDGLEFSSTMRFVVESGSPLDLHHDPLDEAFLEATYDLSNTNGVSTSIRLETSPPERFPTSHEASTLQQVLNLNQVQLAMIRKTNYLARNQLDQMGFKLVHANPNYLIFNTTDPAKPDQ